MCFLEDRLYPKKTPHTIPGYKVNVLFVYVSSQQIYDEVGGFLKFWVGMPVDFFFLVFEFKIESIP